MKKLDWKGVGQFIAVLVKLSTAIISAFKSVNVGIEVLDWLAEPPGRKWLTQACESLAEAYKNSEEYDKLYPTPQEVPKILKAEIDLDKTPSLPFDGAEIEKHVGGGKVVIEKRQDGFLYIDGKKVVLYRSERQLNGKCVKGHELRTELTGKPVLNAGVLDFLFENQDFIPPGWKKDELGNTIYIFFWGTVYRNRDGYLCVRCLRWCGGGWYRYCRWFGLRLERQRSCRSLRKLALDLQSLSSGT